MEWTSRKYGEYRDYYLPWLEDKYLSWRGENKASYGTKQTLQTRVPGAGDDSGISRLQDGVAEGVSGQLAPGGLLGGVGQAVSAEGVNRVERGEPQAASQSWGQWAGGWIPGSGGKDKADR